MLCKLKDIIRRVKDNVDAQNTELEFYIGGEHFGNCEVLITKKGVIKGSTIGPAFHMRFRPGQVLLMSRNPHLRKAGMVDFEGICSDVSYVCETNDEQKFKQRLIPFLFQSDIFWKTAEANKKGSTNFFLNWSDFEKFEFNVPEPEEQEKLADLLWTAEETRQAYKKLIKQTDELVKAKFTEMFGNPITNSKNWPVLPLSVVAPETVGKNIDCQKVWLLNLDMIEDSTGKIIEKVYINKADMGSSTAPFDDTVVLYSKLRPYLNKVVVPNECGYATTELIPLKPDNTKLNKWFLAALLRSSEFVDFAVSLSGGARMPRMPMTSLRNFDCILPPLSLQENFVEFLQQAEQTKIATQQSLDALNETVRALVNRNFN